MNDLRYAVQIYELNFYADDVELHCSNTNLTIAEHDLQQDIQYKFVALCQTF